MIKMELAGKTVFVGRENEIVGMDSESALAGISQIVVIGFQQMLFKEDGLLLRTLVQLVAPVKFLLPRLQESSVLEVPESCEKFDVVDCVWDAQKKEWEPRLWLTEWLEDTVFIVEASELCFLLLREVLSLQWNWLVSNENYVGLLDLLSKMFWAPAYDDEELVERWKHHIEAAILNVYSPQGEEGPLQTVMKLSEQVRKVTEGLWDKVQREGDVCKLVLGDTILVDVAWFVTRAMAIGASFLFLQGGCNFGSQQLGSFTVILLKDIGTLGVLPAGCIRNGDWIVCQTEDQANEAMEAWQPE